MGMMEDFETSLQVIRGFDTDISVEVNEIKVYFRLNLYMKPLRLSNYKLGSKSE